MGCTFMPTTLTSLCSCDFDALRLLRFDFFDCDAITRNRINGVACDWDVASSVG